MNRPLLSSIVSLMILSTACSKGGTAGEAPPPSPLKEKGAPAKVLEGPHFNRLQLASFGALPKRMDIKSNLVSSEKIALGRMLYFDKRLSKNQDLACQTCHVLAQHGIDPRGDKRSSLGHKGQRGTRNAPTVYNAAGQIRQFWDGRAATIEEQAKGPLLNPVEMAMPDAAAVVRVLSSIPGYVGRFERAFPKDKQPITLDHVAEAIGVFERGLTTPSRFDIFLGGRQEALHIQEREGLKAFIETGCPSCHNGVLLGGTSFQKLGAVEPWPEATGPEDQGRFEETKQEADKMIFKVPGLRNVAVTGPYGHDGSTDTLPEMVRKMARYQLAKKALEDSKVEAIVSFLASLTGNPEGSYIAEPTLPESSDATPDPDPS